MIRQDFISKIIEQMVTSIARMLKLDYEKETRDYLNSFEELLKSYYKISSAQLEKLLEIDSERDAFLLDEKTKNLQLKLFLNAGLAFHLENEKQKARYCLKIIERIQEQNTRVFEFPSSENLQLNEEILQLKHLLFLD